MEWKLTTEDWKNRSLIRELRGAMTRGFTARLRGESQAKFTLNGLHPDAMQIEEMVHDLRISCRLPGETTWEECFIGRVGNTQDTLSENTHAVSYQAADYRALIDRKLWLEPKTYTGNYGTVIAAMMTYFTGYAGIGLGFVHDGVAGTISKQITTDVGDSMLDKIWFLANGKPQFDWDIVSNASGIPTLRTWYPQRGVASARDPLEYGKTVSKLTRTITPRNFANIAIVTGGEETAPVYRTTPSFMTDPKGTLFKAYSHPDVKIQATLDAHGDAYIEKDGRQEVSGRLAVGSYTAELAPGFWRGPSHLWLGDTTTMVVVHGRINERNPVRITEVQVNLEDDGGTERVQLVLERI